jgi:hypothetical protein
MTWYDSNMKLARYDVGIAWFAEGESTKIRKAALAGMTGVQPCDVGNPSSHSHHLERPPFVTEGNLDMIPNFIKRGFTVTKYTVGSY